MTKILKSKLGNMLFFIFAIASVLILFTTPVMAAENSQLEMKQLDLQIWPEYDDPRVLAIWNGSLINSSQTDFSGKVYFNIPKGVDIKMACELINGGQHSCQPYALKDKGDHFEISWRVTKPIAPGQEYPFWLEYYYNPLQGNPNKTMNLEYAPVYPTKTLNLTVREPLKSVNFKIDPPSQAQQKDSEGFNNYGYIFQDIKPANPVRLKISYERSETSPSVQPPEKPGYGQGNSNSASNTATGSSFLSQSTGLFILGSGIILIVAMSFYLLGSSRKK